MKFLNHTLDKAIASYHHDARSLSLFRILFAAYSLFTGVVPGIFHLSNFPDTFYTPPIGPGIFFHGFPSPTLIWLLYIGGYVAGVMMLLGMYTRFSSIAFALLTMMGYTFAFSLGKINHNTGFLVLPLVLAFSDWGAYYSWDAVYRKLPQNPERSAAALFSYAFALGWMFFTAGIAKVVGGWLNPATQATYGWFVNYYYAEHVRRLFAPLFIHVQLPIFWEIADWFTAGFEVVFVWAAFRKQRIKILCAVAILFHYMVLNTLNIVSAGFFICYLIFTDLYAIGARFSALRNIAAGWRISSKMAYLLIGTVLTTLLVWCGWRYGSGMEALLKNLLGIEEPLYAEGIVLESTGFAIALWYLGRSLLRKIGKGSTGSAMATTKA